MVMPISPEDLPRWVPGELTVDSASAGWRGVRVRGYRYAPSDVPVPPMKDYMIVVYRQGESPMNRRCTRTWQSEQVTPGMVSVMADALDSHWRWSEPIEVSHLYLSPAAVAEVATDVFEREITSIELRDVLRADDPILAGIAAQLEAEVRSGGLGGVVYADSLRLQASIHLLRRYADVALRNPACSGQFTPDQRRQVTDYVRASLDRPICLDEMAAQLHLSVFHFCRKFRATFDTTPHAWLLQQRVSKAQSDLARRDLPLKAIAADAGFSDQSHMTRVFRRIVGVTPAAYRSERLRN